MENAFEGVCVGREELPLRFGRGAFAEIGISGCSLNVLKGSIIRGHSLDLGRRIEFFFLRNTTLLRGRGSIAVNRVRTTPFGLGKQEHDHDQR